MGGNLVHVRAGIAPGGAPFISGSDDYARLWREVGFDQGFVRNFDSVRVDRNARGLSLSPHRAEATPRACSGQNIVLFVEAEKTGTMPAPNYGRAIEARR